MKVNKGLRQGCKGAPFLWNCLTLLLVHDLRDRVPINWIQENLTIYADDFHVGGVFRSCQDLQLLLECIGLLFELLAEFDLSLNPQKSVAILQMTGSQSRKMRALHTQRDQHGERIKIPVGNTVTLVPIKKSTIYLGCIMSYKHFADSTTWHRVRLAQIGFSRMRRWLCNKQFSRQHRLQLWKTCILPIMHYGVFAVGITQRGAQHMIIHICKMLRGIAGDHPYHTGHTHDIP